MRNSTQLERYKRLIAFLEENFKEDINIEKIEAVCFYSYRNINRIFQALHNETIGKYIKRLRLEKAAQYLLYANISVTEIAYEVGFEDRAAFSKAFKTKYGCAPSVFRAQNESLLDAMRQSLLPQADQEREVLSFETVYLPDFDYIFLEYRGDYQDLSEINTVWKELEAYATNKELLSERSIFMTEIIDDEQITDHIHSRYNCAFILEKPLDFMPEGLFRTKSHSYQKYAKFVHEGAPTSSVEFYNRIFAFWMEEVALELADTSILEFYPHYSESTSPDHMLTEIYIPVQ